MCREKEIEKYLSDRGVVWTEKGQNPVLVRNLMIASFRGVLTFRI